MFHMDSCLSVGLSFTLPRSLAPSLSRSQPLSLSSPFAVQLLAFSPSLYLSPPAHPSSHFAHLSFNSFSLLPPPPPFFYSRLVFPVFMVGITRLLLKSLKIPQTHKMWFLNVFLTPLVLSNVFRKTSFAGGHMFNPGVSWRPDTSSRRQNVCRRARVLLSVALSRLPSLILLNSSESADC